MDLKEEEGKDTIRSFIICNLL